MPRPALGLCLKSSTKPLRAWLPTAAKLGAEGMELLAVGELAPQKLGASARREITHLFASHRLAITAIEAPLRFGLAEPENQEPRIDYLRQMMTLSFDLGCRVVVAPLGPIPKDDDPRANTLAETLAALASFGDRTGATLAVETGLEGAAALAALLAKHDTGSLAATFNPGYALVHGHDPFDAARTLGSRIRIVHAADARRGMSPKLVPLGHGDVDWLEMIATFAEIDYRGFLTVLAENERDAGAGLAFLKRIGG